MVPVLSLHVVLYNLPLHLYRCVSSLFGVLARIFVVLQCCCLFFGVGEHSRRQSFARAALFPALICWCVCPREPSEPIGVTIITVFIVPLLRHPSNAMNPASRFLSLPFMYLVVFSSTSSYIRGGCFFWFPCCIYAVASVPNSKFVSLVFFSDSL